MRLHFSMPRNIPIDSSGVELYPLSMVWPVHNLGTELDSVRLELELAGARAHCQGGFRGIPPNEEGHPKAPTFWVSLGSWTISARLANKQGVTVVEDTRTVVVSLLPPLPQPTAGFLDDRPSPQAR